MSKRRQHPERSGVKVPVALPLAQPAARIGRGWLAVGAAGVLVAVLAAHWTGLHAGALSFDDAEYLTENPLARAPSAASAWRFTSEVLEPSTVHGYYQPLTMIGLMIDCALGGRPDYLLPFHRTSLLLHMANTLLVMLLLYRLFGDALAAGIVGLLFGVHPLTVETIVWVGERKTVLAAFFALLSMAGYLRYARTKASWAYAASLGAFVLALLAKPTVTPLPVCLLLLDYWPLARFNFRWRSAAMPVVTGPEPSWRRVLLEKLPFLAIAAVSAVITVESQRRTAVAVMPGEQRSLPAIYIACHNIIFYLWKMVLPIRLSSHYPFPYPLDMSSPAVAAGAVGTTLLIGALIVSWRWTRALVAGWLFFFVAVLPTLGVIGFTNVIASDKYVYWPSFGLMMIAAWAIARLRKRDRRSVTWGLVGAGLCAAVALAVGTRAYLQDWKDTETLFLRMVRLTPDAPAPLDYLGDHYVRVGRAKEAVPLLIRASQAAPAYEIAALHLGEALQQIGDLAGAAAQYRRAIALKPDYFEAYNNLGNVLVALRDLAGAENCYERALALTPKPTDVRYAVAADAHYNLANVLKDEHQPALAEAHYRQAIAIKPAHAAAHKNLAILLSNRGEAAGAIEEYEQALRYQPGYLDVAIHLAGVYARPTDPAFYRPDRAVELAEQAVNATSHEAQIMPRLRALICLAQVHQAIGHADAAREAARSALNLAQATGDAALVRSVQVSLAGGPQGAETRPAGP